YDGLRKDFERLSMASVFNELMLRLAPKHEAAPDLFKLHSNALALLEERTEPGADLMVLNAYLAKLLQWNGSQPRLIACMGCSKPITEIDPISHVSCMIADAGWICSSCRASESKHIQRTGASFTHSLLRITPVALHDFHISLSMPLRQVPAVSHGTREQHEELFRFLEGLFIFHVPGFDQRPLKALKFLGVESTVGAAPLR
ncbi:MAG TPA: DNA repair protein RecO C-terminal domain-containing protein, partial [Bdellovibrionota bacterium]|nr:DNA repair protein RecO C-terminal domain-containing protein [Bdellovibrionota bacterium]